MAAPKVWPGESSEAHPDVFTKIPAQINPDVRLPGQFTNEQLNQFFDKGFVVVKDFFSKSELEPVRQSINNLLNAFAEKLHKHGKIKELYTEYGLFQRLNKIEDEYPGATVILVKHGFLTPEFEKLFSNEKLLNLMEQILGTKEIVGHPVWNMRTKTPQNEATTVPWHQDAGYMDKRAYKVMQPTAWIPLLDANRENGCMEMVSGGHRSGKVAKHQCCHGGTWYVMLEEEEMEKSLGVNMKTDVVTCEVPYGGVVFFNNLIPHRSLNNVSNDTRWSLDLRWQRADQPIGFYDLKEGVLLRSADPNHKIDWKTFNAIDRTKEAEVFLHKDVSEFFDPTVVGPWMNQWEIVHVNKHTKRMNELEHEKKT